MDPQQLLRLIAERDDARQFFNKYQERMLQQTVRHAYAHSAFYRRQFDAHGVDPQAIKTVADLERLPFFTTPADIVRDSAAFLCVPREQVTYTWHSAGTTGQPKEIFFSDEDIKALAGVVKLGLAAFGMGRDEMAQICYAFGDSGWFVGPFLELALKAAGVRALAAGNERSIAEQLDLIRAERSTMLFGTPSYIHRLTEEGKKIADLRTLGVRMITLGAEPWAESLRDYLCSAWGADVFDNYGMTEMGLLIASECPAHAGLHTSQAVLVEVVDPQTGETCAAGQEGEVVLTTLTRKAMPLIRYRSGDIASRLPDEPCACKFVQTPRLSRIKGRLDDMTILANGENIYPAQIDACLLPIEHLIDYQLILGKDGYRDTLLVAVETNAPSTELEERVLAALYVAIPCLHHDVEQTGTIAAPRVEFRPRISSGQKQPVKTRRIVDLRKKLPL